MVVFFVLSGFVISHATSRLTENLRTFINHRAARILSVSIPALALCVLIAPFASNYSLPESGPISQNAIEFTQRIAVNLVFIAQSWNINSLVPFNAPYWSLNFEVWYYAIFAVMFYTKGRCRLMMVTICVLLAGYKILLLFPVWLMGVAIQRKPIQLKEQHAMILFIITGLCGLIFYFFNVSIKIREWAALQWPLVWPHLNGANQFIGDSILGLLVAGNFVAVGAMPSMGKILLPAKGFIRFFASYTFSIYLYHFPFAALLWVWMGITSPIPFFTCLFLCIGLLGHITERRVGYVREVLKRLFSDHQKVIL